MILGQTHFAGDSLILRKKSAIIKHFECCHTKIEQNCKELIRGIKEIMAGHCNIN